MEQLLQILLTRLERIEALLAGKSTDEHIALGRPLSLKQAAEYLHLSLSRMYGLIYQGRLHPLQRQRNSKILFSREELNRYLRDGKNHD